MSLRQRLHIIMRHFNLNRSGLAVRCKISESSLSKAAINDIISLKIARAIAFTLNISSDWIMHGTGDMHDVNTQDYPEISKGYDNQTLEVYKSLKKPKEITVNFPLLKNSGETRVIIEEDDKYNGEGVYALNINGLPKICAVSMSLDGSVVLESLEEKKIISYAEFEKLEILGKVIAFLKNMN